MSDEELSNQITKIAVEIEKVEQTAKQKKTYFANKCDERNTILKLRTSGNSCLSNKLN